MDDDYLPQEGYVVTFEGDPDSEGKFFRILRREGFTYRTGDTSGTAEFSTVASGSNTGFKDIKVLEPDRRPQRCAFVKMGFKDGLQYAFKLKSGTIRFGPDKDKNAAKIFNVNSPWFEPDPQFDFWLLGPDWYPSIQATNVTPFTATPLVYFSGFKFDLEEVPPDEASTIQATGRYTRITLGGIAS